ncbi:MAG TPA: FAD-dependent oxidoreductase [Mycobacterium sp.]|uniref:FAD-dependent oxidoreductase n=1 Tax=Mycobacterium sp. TaxID=1785 RepID=UPI002F401E5E
MAYVITQNCCKDGSCVPVCPVDCIRPVAEPGEFTMSEMLYIDPVACIDCGACLEECPVDAIYADEDLPPELERFRDINEAYFERHPLNSGMPSTPADHEPVASGPLRIAIVGAGPAACYTASELLRVDGVEVDLFERLPTPFGLIRAGVAPDHQDTKSVVDIFDAAFVKPGLRCHLNVEVGRDISHDDLMAHHHAVIYAVGASRSRDLAIPGQDRPGSHAAADFVAWYNGHPDHARDTFDLSGQRAVIIGNGNVALDVARMLLLPHEELARTDIADHALTALADSKIREVVILARRSPRDAAFSVGEFHALGQLPGIDVIIDSDDLDSNPTEAVETALKLDIARGFAQRQPSPDNKRIVFRFMVSPAEIVGDGDVEGLRLVHNSFGPSGSLVSGDPDRDAELIETSLILRSIGHTGMAIEGVPFEAATGTVPNQGGRVLDGQGQPIIGLYVTGWIKRGPRGVIGTNRTCAQETVASLWADFDKGRLARDVNDHSALDQLLGQCGAKPIDWHGWCAINSAECKKGKDASRPRVKFVDVATMVAIANSER